MAVQSFTMFSGDSKSLVVSIVDDSDVAVDVSTATTIKYWLAKNASSESAEFSKAVGSGIAVATSTVTVTIDAADTESLVGNYYHELEITDAVGLVYTAFSGRVTITKDVIP